jgi:hypothetical protein
MAGLCPGSNIEHLHVTTNIVVIYVSGTRGRSLRFHTGLGFVPTLVTRLAPLVIYRLVIVAAFILRGTHTVGIRLSAIEPAGDAPTVIPHPRGR